MAGSPQGITESKGPLLSRPDANKKTPGQRADLEQGTFAITWTGPRSAPNSAFPNLERERSLDILRRRRPVPGDPPVHEIDRRLRERGLVRRDRRQRGQTERALLVVVEADDRDVLRHPQALLGHRPQGPD